MIYVFVSLLILLVFLFSLYQQSTVVEPMFATSNNTITMYCLGDSVLNNSNYATESVETCLKRDVPSDYQVVMLAKDGATIQDVEEKQLIQTNKTDNTNKTNKIIILSVGGNDLLKEKEEPRHLFQQFLKLIEDIHNTVGKNTPLYVLGLYYPTLSIYTRFHSRIRDWNAWLLENSVLCGYVYIPLANVISEKDDITAQIEPSNQGGAKIAKQIVKIACE